MQIQTHSRQQGKTAAMRMHLSLYYEGKFQIKKLDPPAWCVSRGGYAILFRDWERAWHFLFGVDPYARNS